MESFGLKMLHKSYGKFIDKTETFKVDYVDPYITAIERSTAKNTMFAPKRMVLHLKVGNFTAIHDFDANQVRPYDTLKITYQTHSSSSAVIINVFEINQALGMSVLMSTITFVVLLSWEKVLQADYKRHIVDPIYNIIGALGRLAADPRLAVQLAETGGNFESDENGSPTEIIMIGKAIAKFGHLLNIGFGEAGVEIISRNLRQGQGEFHPVAKGKKSQRNFRVL